MWYEQWVRSRLSSIVLVYAIERTKCLLGMGPVSLVPSKTGRDLSSYPLGLRLRASYLWYSG
jgi:hypothetical protein